jgi:hypothetical protein
MRVSFNGPKEWEIRSWNPKNLPKNIPANLFQVGDILRFEKTASGVVDVTWSNPDERARGSVASLRLGLFQVTAKGNNVTVDFNGHTFECSLKINLRWDGSLKGTISGSKVDSDRTMTLPMVGNGTFIAQANPDPPPGDFVR